MTALPPNVAAIAPDRAGLGTNGLSLPLPAARDFQFCFGSNSFGRHRDEAARLDLLLEIIHSDTLAFDVDEPADLLALAESLRSGDASEYPGLHLALPMTPRHSGRAPRSAAQTATAGR